jgi:hypothetical protein
LDPKSSKVIKEISDCKYALEQNPPVVAIHGRFIAFASDVVAPSAKSTVKDAIRYAGRALGKVKVPTFGGQKLGV